MGASRPGRREPPITTDEFLAAILDELTAIRSQLVQEPQEPQEPSPAEPQLVSEPAPGWER